MANTSISSQATWAESRVGFLVYIMSRLCSQHHTYDLVQLVSLQLVLPTSGIGTTGIGNNWNQPQLVSATTGIGHNWYRQQLVSATTGISCIGNNGIVYNWHQQEKNAANTSCL